MEAGPASRSRCPTCPLQAELSAKWDRDLGLPGGQVGRPARPQALPEAQGPKRSLEGLTSPAPAPHGEKGHRYQERAWTHAVVRDCQRHYKDILQLQNGPGWQLLLPRGC